MSALPIPRGAHTGALAALLCIGGARGRLVGDTHGETEMETDCEKAGLSVLLMEFVPHFLFVDPSALQP